MKYGAVLGINSSYIYATLGGGRPSTFGNDEEVYEQALQIADGELEPFKLFVAQTYTTNFGDYLYVTGKTIADAVQQGSDKLHYTAIPPHTGNQQILDDLIQQNKSAIVEARKSIYMNAVKFIQKYKGKTPAFTLGVQILTPNLD